MQIAGNQIYDLAIELFPICRSITGDGVRKTLEILKRELPLLEVHEVPSGTKCFDWQVPKEWNINDAYILDPNGNKIIDFQKSNLYVVNYSCPINKKIKLEELQKHLYSLPEQPDAIPYITSYYKESWGFCLSHTQRQALLPGEYTVVIDSQLKEGYLSYGEFILKGESEFEVLLSTYLCHPSLANDNLSGVCVTTYLAKWLQELPRRYTYRIVFIPETIGSIVYLSKNMHTMKRNTIAGFNITCVGDNEGYSYLPSRQENTLADKVALHVLKHSNIEFECASYLDRGSDERQYCSPGIDLPVASVMRSRYDTYHEYHTSLDNLEFISPQGLFGGFDLLRHCLECIECNFYYKTKVFCEPQLGKRGLYPNVSTKNSFAQVQLLTNLIAYCDGTNSLLQIAEKIKQPLWNLVPMVKQLIDADLLEPIQEYSIKNVSPLASAS